MEDARPNHDLLRVAGPRFRHRRSSPDARCLFDAVGSGLVDFVRELLEQGTDPNSRRRRGSSQELETPLSVAVAEGEAACVRLLLDAGASPLISLEPDPLRRPHPGHMNLLYVALNRRHGKVAEILLGHRQSLWLLVEFLTLPLGYKLTTDEQNLAMMGDVLRTQCEVDVHYRDFEHTVKTPLTTAIIREDAPMAELLCKYGASVNKSMYTERVFTPLMTAAYKASGSARRELISLLLARGARTNIQTEKGNTALHMAVHKRCCYESILLLLQHGADVNRRDHKGRTACNTALSRVYFPALRLLLEAGVVTDFGLPFDSLSLLPEPFITWIKHFNSQTRSLKELSAKVIRARLGENLKSGVHKLPLPEPIKCYLFFAHLDFLGPLFGTGKDSTELSTYAWLVP